MFAKQLKLAAKGFCIGTADIIPGVSGGTMAFVLGIYPQLLAAIKSFDYQWLKMIYVRDIKAIIDRPHFGFLLPLGIGVVLAVLFFTKVLSLPLLIRQYPELIYSLFFGLIVGTIMLFCKQLGLKQLAQSAGYLLAGLLLGGLVVVGVPVTTPDHSGFIFLCGVISSAAMLLPGLSGSFILLLLKKYVYIFDAIASFELLILLPFAAGVAVGLIILSRLLLHLIKTYYQQTMAFIIGLLLASLYAIWPFQLRGYAVLRDKAVLVSSVPYLPTTFNMQLLYALAIIASGVGIVLWLSRLAAAKI